MKSLKKMFALVIAMVMTLAMVVPAMAADPAPYTITINKDTTDKAAHTYGAYQLFKGNLDAATGTLGQVEWGENVTGATVISGLNALKDDNNEAIFTLAATATAADVAKAIGEKEYGRDSAEAQALADVFEAALTGDPVATGTITANVTSGTISIPQAKGGYYLVKDTATVSGEGAQTRYILEVVKDVTVAEKASVPSVQKKVKEKNDTTGAETGWQDAADYDIGDSIPYQLTGTLPSKFAEFDTYKVYTFNDEFSDGLTMTEAQVAAVTIKTGTQSIKGLFDVEYDATENKLTVSLKNGVDLRAADLKDDDNAAVSFTSTSTIVVEYNATLDTDAVIGTPGNPNEVDLEFSNNPNYDSDGTETGKTPKDKVCVFTYEIKANKVEDDGEEVLSAAQYEALSDAVKATYTEKTDDQGVKTYTRQKTKALSGAGFTLYKKVPTGTTGAVDGYLQIGNEITGGTTFEFKGTDAGEYKLVETTVPAGYNKAEDITITVTATYDTDSADPQLKSLTVTPPEAKFTVTTTQVENDAEHITTNGIISGDILNQKGTILPSTGGIGTTIFYVVGAILVLGAGILLVTRRRMSAN